MSESTALDRFLATDPRDVGCELAMQVLHVYVDLVVAGRREGFPRNGEDHHPGVAAHLRACGPCSEDFEGLLVAVEAIQ